MSTALQCSCCLAVVQVDACTEHSLCDAWALVKCVGEPELDGFGSSAAKNSEEWGLRLMMHYLAYKKGEWRFRRANNHASKPRHCCRIGSTEHSASRLSSSCCSNPTDLA